MEKKYSRPNWPLRIAGILLCMVMISINLLSGIFARYVVTASAEDSARVAKFDVQFDLKQGNTEITELLNIDMIPGKTETYTIQIQNTGEVAVDYSLSVQLLTNNLPLTLQLSGGNAANSGGVWTANGIFLPNSGAASYTLTVRWDGSSSAALAGEVDVVRIALRAEQID